MEKDPYKKRYKQYQNKKYQKDTAQEKAPTKPSGSGHTFDSGSAVELLDVIAPSSD